MELLRKDEIVFAKASIVDPVGRTFFHKNRVFRAIYSREFADVCTQLLKEEWFEKLFGLGLVKTWISEDFKIEDVPLILEHQKIPFDTHPVEWTAHMHWLAAKTMVNINIKLSQYGYLLKDSHPWNLMYHKGYPKFIDFGSIIKAEKISNFWIEEFRKYFAVPIWIASSRWKRFALEYRREHTKGFGLELFNTRLIKKILFRKFNKISSYSNQPSYFFKELDQWLDKHKPNNPDKEQWSNYNQEHNSLNPLEPKTVKQKFVYDVLTCEKPLTVLDCAANRGFYAEMAAALGSSVVAFDYEEFCIDEILKLVQTKNLDITPVVMDFKYPTPNYGMSLAGSDAFERFQADIVLALGLIHHLCIVQKMPVKIFCEICMKYANQGIILEYVDPLDKHVFGWKKPIATDYSLEKICQILSDNKFSLTELIEFKADGILRTFIYFRRQA